MSALDQVKGVVAQGDKDSAMAMLASMLIKNKNDLEAWLLLGELVDDPSRKKDCYRWALWLSPDHPLALAKLQELGEPLPADLPVTGPGQDQTDHEGLIKDTKQNLNPVPGSNSSSSAGQSNTGVGIIWYMIWGIAAFLLLLYVIANPSNFSNSTKVLYVALIFIGLIAGIIIASASNRRS